MFNIREKLGRSLSKRRSENNSLRLFEPNKGFQPSVVDLEKADREDLCAGSRKEIRNAMLEAERATAMVMMRLEQQRQRFC